MKRLPLIMLLAAVLMWAGSWMNLIVRGALTPCLFSLVPAAAAAMSGISTPMAAAGYILSSLLYLFFAFLLLAACRGHRSALRVYAALLIIDFGANVFGTLISLLMLIGCAADILYLILGILLFRRAREKTGRGESNGSAGRHCLRETSAGRSKTVPAAQVEKQGGK